MRNNHCYFVLRLKIDFDCLIVVHFKSQNRKIYNIGYIKKKQKKKVNLGEYETEEDILDAIEQSRRITRLIISAVQKGSKFEVSQILEHYGLPMTSRLHFKVTNIVMEQWVRLFIIWFILYFFLSFLFCLFVLIYI